MKQLILILIGLVFCSQIFANSVSTDVSEHDEKLPRLNAKTLRKQLILEGTVWILSPDGKTLYSKGQELRQWKFSPKGDLISHWSFSSAEVDFIGMKQKWTINKKGQLEADIAQYAKNSVKYNPRGGVEYIGKPLNQKKFVIENFEPVTWVAYTNKAQRVVVRMTPTLQYNKDPQEIGKIPISAEEMIAADNKGFVWTPEATFSGEYITLRTSRGTIHISYLPFKGGKEIGFVEDNKMRINLGEKHYLRLISNSHFIPSGMQAKVFGRVNLKDKAQKGSTHIQSSSEEKEFLSTIK